MDLCLSISAGEVDIPAGENVFVVCFILLVNSLNILAGLHVFVCILYFTCFVLLTVFFEFLQLNSWKVVFLSQFY